MISLGLIDMVLIIVLVVTFIGAIRKHTLLPFAIVLIVVALIEFERFAPGSLTVMQNAIRGIDSINAQLPHIQISPIVTLH